jgi:hypothetical protein
MPFAYCPTPGASVNPDSPVMVPDGVRIGDGIAGISDELLRPHVSAKDGCNPVVQKERFAVVAFEHRMNVHGRRAPRLSGMCTDMERLEAFLKRSLPRQAFCEGVIRTTVRTKSEICCRCSKLAGLLPC